MGSATAVVQPWMDDGCLEGCPRAWKARIHFVRDVFKSRAVAPTTPRESPCGAQNPPATAAPARLWLPRIPLPRPLSLEVVAPNLRSGSGDEGVPHLRGAFVVGFSSGLAVPIPPVTPRNFPPRTVPNPPSAAQILAVNPSNSRPTPATNRRCRATPPAFRKVARVAFSATRGLSRRCPFHGARSALHGPLATRLAAANARLPRAIPRLPVVTRHKVQGTKHAFFPIPVC